MSKTGEHIINRLNDGESLSDMCDQFEFALNLGRKDVSGHASETLKRSVFNALTERWHAIKKRIVMIEVEP